MHIISQYKLLTDKINKYYSKNNKKQKCYSEKKSRQHIKIKSM